MKATFEELSRRCGASSLSERVQCIRLNLSARMHWHLHLNTTYKLRQVNPTCNAPAIRQSCRIRPSNVLRIDRHLLYATPATQTQARLFQVRSMTKRQCTALNPSECKDNYSATSNNMKLVVGADRWQVSCYIWYSDEGTVRDSSPPRPHLAVPNVTAHPSTAGVPSTVLLYNGPFLRGFNVPLKGLTKNIQAWLNT